MSDPNIYVSNGTCYTAPGVKLNGEFIPCGNDAFGHQTCCGAGDNCLEDNSCFGVHGSGYGSDLTYLAGCSDPAYKDASCPKKVVDQPWVALTLCDNSNGEWAICSQIGNPSTLQNGAYCSCTVASSATVAFSISTIIPSICSLPKSIGESIQFFVGHTPTSSLASSSVAPSKSSGATSTSATSTSAAGGSSAASSSAAATSNPTSTKAASSGSSSTSVIVTTSSGRIVTSTIVLSASSGTAAVNGSTTSSGSGTDSGLSLGAKVGIGVGAGLGALIVLAAILAFFLLRRKRGRRSPSEFETGDGDKDTKPSKLDSSDENPVSATTTTPTDANGKVMQEAGGRAAQPWTMRSELEGSHVPRTGELNPIAELPGSENFAGEQGAGNTLATEAQRQIGPAWRGQSLKLLNNNTRNE